MTEYTYNVISAVWFGTTGIVRVRPKFGDDKFYIGTGHGHDAEKDAQHIAEWGLSFYPKNLETFFDLSK